ncbi:M14 family metallopeptidase [Robiginitalea biformata]|uniref:M14 family metallopeptidase n=1 Tax=Robiginitalea biformata TaxID=252307 RepID=UPI003B5C7B74
MKHCFALFLSFFTAIAFGQELQSPSEFLGYELGTQFTRHHRVVEYFRYVADARSEQVLLEQYGETNERRPLITATLSSAANMQRLGAIREAHLEALEGQGSQGPAIVWLSYNVHGNESVSTEASMQTLYDLLTTRSSYLENTVVIMDPCINPDGRDRYVNWYNQFKNTPYQADPNSKEHHEGWLSGRGNHYMFDLNRDWAWLTQRESRERLVAYNRWMPHVHVDFHEQGVDAPYYFAPAAEPYHEVITEFQRRFQDTIGRNHARYFDANGWFYFTREVFDLFYPSYGDTYPTYNGAIGMTYEQGGSGRAGLAIRTSIGDTLTLKDRIAHHLTTGLSTVEVASRHAGMLGSEFRKFYGSPKNFKYKSYVLKGDRDKLAALRDLLEQHQVRTGRARGGSVRGFRYDTGRSGSMQAGPEALVVPTDQPKGTLVKVLFERDARLSDSLTYDITAWSLPYAYGLQAIASESAVAYDSPADFGDAAAPAPESGAYAYLTDWDSMDDARFLAALLKEGFRVRRASRPFQLEGRNWAAGTLIITAGDNRHHADFSARLEALRMAHGRELTPAGTGLVDSGKDFGSRYVDVVSNVRVAVLSGEPTSTLDFGEVWHFFEQQLHYPLTVLDTDYFDRVDLDAYDVLVLPDGRGYRRFLNEKRVKGLKAWVAAGGRLIAMGGALDALGGDSGFSIEPKKSDEAAGEEAAPGTDPLSFEAGQRERIRSAITGAIFKTRVDPTHPMAFGYGDSYFSLKLGSSSYELLDSGNVSYLMGQPVPVAGFAGSEALKKLPNSLVFGVENHGRGQVVYMVDNPLFRGFWENGKLFFANALFMGN